LWFWSWCLLLKVAREAQGCFDVHGLSAFVSSGQENNQLTPTLLEIHPITGTVINSKFGDTLADRLNITGISSGKTFNPDLDTRSRLEVTKRIKPMVEKISFSNFNHKITVALWLHIVNNEFVSKVPNVKSRSILQRLSDLSDQVSIFTIQANEKTDLFQAHKLNQAIADAHFVVTADAGAALVDCA
jgi:hypothetical protein